MLKTLVMYSGNGYFFQQLVVFLMWMGLLKIAYGELRAIWTEEGQAEHAPPCCLDDGLGRAVRKKTENGRRGMTSSTWKVKPELPQGIRRRSKGGWNRVRIS